MLVKGANDNQLGDHDGLLLMSRWSCALSFLPPNYLWFYLFRQRNRSSNKCQWLEIGRKLKLSLIFTSDAFANSLPKVKCISIRILWARASDGTAMPCDTAPRYGFGKTTINNMMTSSNGNIFRVTGPFCAGNSPVPGEFPAQRPVTRSFDVFFDRCPNKRLSKQSWGWWFKTSSRPLWRHRNESAQNALVSACGIKIGAYMP